VVVTVVVTMVRRRRRQISGGNGGGSCGGCDPQVHSARLDMPGHFNLLRGYLPDPGAREVLGWAGRPGPLWEKLIFDRLAVYFCRLAHAKPATSCRLLPRVCARHQDWHVSSARHVQGS
jgi:hypothetical protein